MSGFLVCDLLSVVCVAAFYRGVLTQCEVPQLSVVGLDLGINGFYY